MTVESDYAMAMASDWFQNLAPVFQQIGSKTKTNPTLYARLFLHLWASDLICTPSEVAKVLKSLNANKACGRDGVSPRSKNATRN